MSCPMSSPMSCPMSSPMSWANGELWRQGGMTHDMKESHVTCLCVMTFQGLSDHRMCAFCSTEYGRKHSTLQCRIRSYFIMIRGMHSSTGTIIGAGGYVYNPVIHIHTYKNILVTVDKGSLKVIKIPIFLVFSFCEHFSYYIGQRSSVGLDYCLAP